MAEFVAMRKKPLSELATKGLKNPMVELNFPSRFPLRKAERRARLAPGGMGQVKGMRSAKARGL